MAPRLRRARRMLLPALLLGVLAAQATTTGAARDPGDLLREAARAGDLATVRAQLAAGTPVDAAGRNAVTPLHLAAGQGHAEVVAALLGAGAAIDHRESFFQQSALEMALGGGHRGVALALLAAGADDATSALETAAETGDLELARAALARGNIEPLDLTAIRRELAANAETAAGGGPDSPAPEVTAGRVAIASLLATAPTDRPVAAPAADATGGFRPDPDRLRSSTGRYRGRDLEIQAELRGTRLVLTLEGTGAAAIAAAAEVEASAAGTASGTASAAAGEATTPGAAPAPATLVLELEPTARDRFHTASGDTRFVVAGRAGLIEWAELNRNGHRFGLSAVTAPPAPELAAAGSGEVGPALRTPARPWPQFRGPGASGNGDGQGAPARWDLAAGGNVRFKTPIPGLALSSPIVFGDRIYVTTAISAKGDNTFRTGLYGDGTSVDDLSEHRFVLLALDTATGAVRWEREVARVVPTVRRHLKSSLANPTPATDGDSVVVLFSTIGVLAAYDRDGNERWRRELGALDCNDPQAGAAEWGCASSPVLHDGLVFVQADHRRDSFLAAFRLADGSEVWRVARAEPSTWATPALLPAPGHQPSTELVTNGTTIRGYDPATGAELWRLGPNSEVVVATPVIGPAPSGGASAAAPAAPPASGATTAPGSPGAAPGTPAITRDGDGSAPSLAYVTAGYPPVRPVYAIRAGQRGDLSLPQGESASPAIVWSHPRGGTYLPTPLLYRGHLYTLNNNGLLTVYRADDGSEVHRARVGPSGTSFSASPVAADGRLYLAAEGGEVFVLAAAPDFGLLAVNPMQEVVMATPAIADGLLVVRTLGHLVGLAEEPRGDGPDAVARAGSPRR
jgi:outer membrane protein assembly factor BamB